jgi:hypothetical protein
MKLIFLTLLFTFKALACDGGLALNKKQIEVPINSLLGNSISEIEFRSSIKSFETFFADWIDQEHNTELVVVGSWKSNTVNAFAERVDGKFYITIYGGLARHPAVTRDGFQAVLCHELGHHLGGYPKKSTNRWSSAEGQADYYASMKCLRRLWAKEDNIAIMQTQTIPTHLKQECRTSFKSAAEQALCERMGMAGKSVALMIQDLDHDSIEPKFETPDTLVVRAMNYMHPYAQCRLDTYFQGAICPVSEWIEFDDDDETKGSCHSRLGDKIGLRPRCWFYPRI